MKSQKFSFKIIFWAGILLAQILLFYALSKSAVVQNFQSFFEWQKAFHQRIFANLAFSAGDVFYVVTILVMAFLIGLLFIRKRRKNTVKALFIVLNLFYFLYQIFWGMLYFQKPVAEKLPYTEPTLEEAKLLSTELLEKCKNTRQEVEEDQNGIFKIADLNKVKQEILIQQKLIPKTLFQENAVEIVDFKPSLFGSAMSYSGILGYYNPFTAEAQYNPHLPHSALPFTLAHESAHQMGIAREQEANFAGYLIGKNSTNLDLKYSAEFSALRSLLTAIYPSDSLFVKKIVNNYSPPMKRDRIFEKNFYKKHQGAVEDFFGWSNDLFLKSNLQEGSITYTYFTDLLLKYEISQKKKNHVSQRGSKNTNDEKKFIALP